MKTLREWLIENDLSHHDMAKRLGTSQQNVSRWMATSTPTLEMMGLIKEVTKGEVDYASFHLNEKYEGDRRLHKRGLISDQVMSRWHKADE